MKYLAKLTVTLVLSILVGALIDGAHASGRSGAQSATRKKGAKISRKGAISRKAPSYGGDALKPKTNLKLDGRSSQALRPGKFDSLSLGDEGAKGAKRLYSLPANFASRAADSESEMRYRQ